MAIDLAETLKRGMQNVSKVEIYRWGFADKKGYFAEIDKRDIQVDHEYQREKIAWQKVKDLTRNWSWAGCGCILVAKREDGSYWVFDGQHRVLASMRRADIDTLPCLVFQTHSKVSEAKGFLFANSERKPVLALDKFRAAVMTGDETAVKANDIFKKHAIELDTSPSKPRQLKCVALCLRLVQRNCDAFEWALCSALRLCSDRPVHSDILHGLFWIENKYKLCGDNRFESALMNASPDSILDSIARYAAAEGKRGDAVCGKGILKILNHKRRNKFGDEPSLDE